MATAKWVAIVPWLQSQWLVLWHGTGLILLLLVWSLIRDLNRFLPIRSPLVETVESGLSLLFVGTATAQIGMIAIWCGLGSGDGFSRAVKGGILLSMGWAAFVVFSLAADNGNGPRYIELPIVVGMIVVILFMPTFLIAWGLRFQNGWRIAGPGQTALSSPWQSSIGNLLALISLACFILTLGVWSRQVFSESVGRENWFIYVILVWAAGASFFATPILVFATWGLLAENVIRYHRFSAIFTGILLLGGFGAFVLQPVFSQHPAYSLVSIVSIFLACLCMTLLLTAWALRPAGYRLLRLPQD